ncbi:MAG: hypothetical protein MJZ06_02700 [Bacteroidaceae bacterium]|nr:hypothetical protein [Bacteroidaceae bacterium]
MAAGLAVQLQPGTGHKARAIGRGPQSDLCPMEGCRCGVFRGMAVKRQGLSGVKKRGCLSGGAASSAFQPERPQEQAMERTPRTGILPSIHPAPASFHRYTTK